LTRKIARQPDQRPSDRAEPHHRPDDRERLLLTLVAEQLTDQPEALRDHDRRDRSLQRPGRDQGAR
jgi:hypothetical protein